MADERKPSIFSALEGTFSLTDDRHAERSVHKIIKKMKENQRIEGYEFDNFGV